MIRFSEQDLQLFSAASGDRNPLHMSPSYASQTAYGQQVVFGGLGALACLGQIRPGEGQRIARLTADFHRPIFLDIDYQVKAERHAKSERVRLFDGTVPLLTLAAHYEHGEKQEPHLNPRTAVFEHPEAAEWKESEIIGGLNISGRYRADPAQLAALCSLWNVTEPLVGETLLWGSYLVGMQLPGRRALFFRFDLKLEVGPVSPGPFEYEASVASFKAAIGQIRMNVSLTSESQPLASGQFLSFIRPETGAIESAGNLESNTFAGRVAVVIGGSRGLGGAITGALAMHGARVIAISRSGKRELLAAYPAEAARRISMETGDAGDHDWLSKLRDRVRVEYGRLDFLVCNAFPAIPALRLELNALPRIQEYIGRATALVLTPLCGFLELLNESGGCAVIVSSMAVEQPVREWPHYIAAKNGIEGLARIAPLQYPRIAALIVRPERLLTEMANTPMGRRNALPPQYMAAQIVERLRKPRVAGTTELLRSTGIEQLQDATPLPIE